MYLVTGASSGIGRATAVALIERGCDVTVVARRLDELLALQQLAPDRVVPLQANLGTETGTAAVVTALQAHPVIAGVIHGAGSRISLGAYGDLDRDAMALDMAVHVTAPIALNGALRAQLVGGRVAFIDSYSATSLREGWSGYSIVKAAAQMAARAAASELTGCSVIRIFPGGVRTELVEAVLDAAERSPAVDAFRSMGQRGELVEPGVVGEFIAHVLLDATDAQLAEHETWDFTNDAAQF